MSTQNLFAGNFPKNINLLKIFTTICFFGKFSLKNRFFFFNFTKITGSRYPVPVPLKPVRLVLENGEKPVCTANMDIVNSEKDVIDSITVKCALNLRHVNQQKLAENNIPKTLKDTKQKKLVNLEVNVAITTKQIKKQVSPVSARVN